MTSYSGLVLIEYLFDSLSLRQKLKSAFAHLRPEAIYSFSHVLTVLIVHILLGFRRLREIDYYRHDPYVQRLVRLNRLPDFSVISRSLSAADEEAVVNVCELNRALVTDSLLEHDFKRVTIDFDGSVISTRGHAEGTAVGYNTKKRGARSYYPLFATIAQTGQFLDFFHRPGNVHDSKGAERFMMECLDVAHEALPSAKLESRFDSARFEENRLVELDKKRVEFTCSVPWARYPELKRRVEQQDTWIELEKGWSFPPLRGLQPSGRMGNGSAS